MKKWSTTLLVTLALSLLMAGTALAKDIVIFNGTNFDIMGVFMSASDDGGWGDNLVAEEPLRPGEGLKITIAGVARELDLAVVDDENQELELMELDFTEFDTLTLFSDGTGRFE